MQLYTIGHSNRSLEEFLEILKTYSITYLVDVRTLPKSRHVPWSNQHVLSKTLEKIKITYHHLPELGGLRHPKPNSINLGWKNLSFRGFADYMQTNEFYLALKSLNTLIQKDGKIVIMCAEALPWRCHRSLIADAEVIRHIQVYHIFNITNIAEHQLTPFAKINKTKKPYKVYYPDKV